MRYYFLIFLHILPSICFNIFGATKATFTLTYYAGETQGNIQVAEGGNIIDALSSIIPVSLDNTSKTFVGWTNSPIPEKTQDSPEFISSEAVMPANDYVVYAVFAKEQAEQAIEGCNLLKDRNSWSSTNVNFSDNAKFTTEGSWVKSPYINTSEYHHLVIKCKVSYHSIKSTQLKIYAYKNATELMGDSEIKITPQFITPEEEFPATEEIYTIHIIAETPIHSILLQSKKETKTYDPIYITYLEIFTPITYADYITFSAPELPLQIIEWKTDSYIIMYNGDPEHEITTLIENHPETSSTQTLTECKKDIAVYEIPFQGLSKYSNQSLTIQIGDNHKQIKVPIIISEEIIDTELIEKYQDGIESIVILNQGTLTTTQTSFSCQDITIYAGGCLDISKNTSVNTNNLTIRIGAIENNILVQRSPSISMEGTLNIATDQINADILTTIDYYYSFALPGRVQTTDIHYPIDIYGDNVSPDNTGSFQIKYYDGSKRATNGIGWTILDETQYTSLSQSSGYAFWGIPKKVTVEDNILRQKFALHRLPIKNISNLPTGQITANVGAYGTNTDTPPNNIGWNYLGNPYFVSMGNPSEPDELLQIGIYEREIDASGNWTGNWNFTNDKIRYTTQTFDCQNYISLPSEQVSIAPFSAFFVQAASSGTILFNKTSSSIAQLPAKQISIDKEYEIGIVFSGIGKIDYTGWLFADKFTESYDINADLDKFDNQDLAIYSIGSIGKLAYMATNSSKATEPIKLGYNVSHTGEYTIAFDQEHYSTENLQTLYLMDKDKNISTDLLYSDYTFTTECGTFDDRFELQLTFKSNTSTDIHHSNSQDITIDTKENLLIINNLPLKSFIQIYNLLGAIVLQTYTTKSTIQLQLPTGCHIIKINGSNFTQTFKTIIQ